MPSLHNNRINTTAAVQETYSPWPDPQNDGVVVSISSFDSIYLVLKVLSISRIGHVATPLMNEHVWNHSSNPSSKQSNEW